jgi:PAS domain S-box-containing protein
MGQDTNSKDQCLLEVEDLRIRLEEAQETLSAIRRGEVDGLIVSGAEGDQVFTLKGAERSYRIFVETMNEGAVTLALDGTILYCNDRFADMLEIPGQKIVGDSIYRFISSPERRFEPAFQKGKKGRYKTELRLKGKENKSIPVSLSFNPMTEDEMPGVCLVVTDLTDLVRAHEAMKEHAKKLERINQELSDFAFVASHDMREPLRKIQTFADRIKDKYKNLLPEQGRDYFTRMENSARRMNEILTSLLRYSRISTISVPFTLTDLTELVREAASELQLVFEEHGAKMEIGNLPSAEVDPSQIRQLFQNLLHNSIKFNSSTPPMIRIYGETDGNAAYRIFVQDNGIGFEEEYLDKIFVPFQRLHGRREYAGIGMGLAICRKIVERHDGSITAKSEPGKGSTFIVTLPIKQS